MLNDKDLALVVLSPVFAAAFLTSLFYCICHEVITPIRKNWSKKRESSEPNLLEKDKNGIVRV